MSQHVVLFTDAVIAFEQDMYDVDENGGSVMVCIDSGVTGGFQTVLTVSLSAADGKASE